MKAIILLDFLGLNLKELPCLVFLDDPNGKEYHVLPIRKIDNELFLQLREIIGDFYSTADYKRYFDLLLEWKERNNIVRGLRKRIKENNRHIEEETWMIPTNKIQITHLIQRYNQKIIVPWVRGWLSNVYGAYSIPKEKEANILEKLSDVEMFKKFVAIQKFETSIPYHLKAINETEIYFKEYWQLEKYYRKTLVHFLPQEMLPAKQPSDFSIDEWQKVLTAVISDENSVTQQVKSWMKSIQYEIDEIDLDHVRFNRSASFHQQISTDERSLRLHTRAIDDIKYRLDQQEKPKIEAVFQKLKWAERGHVATAYLDKAARTIGNNAETVIKAIELAMKSQGIS